MAKLSLGMWSRHIHAAGLDVDGVLCNTGYPVYLAIRKAIAMLGGDPPASYGEFVHDFTSRYSDYFRTRGIKGGEEEFMTVYHNHLPGFDATHPYDDVLSTLLHVRQLGLPIFVVSGAETERLEAWFDMHGFAEHISHVRGDSRDKTACITAACDHLGIMPEMTFFVGDCGLDIRAAREVGSVPIGITRGYDSAEALRRSGAAHVLEHLSELQDALS